MSASIVRTFTLSAGQTQLLRLPRDTTLVLVSGAVTVRQPPRWMSDAWVDGLQARLHGGGVLVTERAGWFTLVARSEARIRLEGPAASRGWTDGMQALRHRLAAWRQNRRVGRAAVRAA